MKFDAKSAAVVTFCALCAVLFMVGLYPGSLCVDSAVILNKAVSGSYTENQSLFLQMLTSVLLVFDAGLVPGFFLHILLYWISVGIISVLLSRRSLFWGLAILLCSLLPYPLWLQGVVIKDTGSMVLLLLFHSVSYALLLRRASPKTTLTFAAVLGAAVYLIRPNAISIVPVMALAAACIGITALDFEKKRTKWMVVIGMILLVSAVSVLSVKAINKIISSVVSSTPDPAGYYKGHLFPCDVVGMSIYSGHEGVTRVLPDKRKTKLTRLYDGDSLFWKTGRKLAGRSWPGIVSFEEWRRHVARNPGWYAGHRWHTFRKLFDGTGQVPYNVERRYWFKVLKREKNRAMIQWYRSPSVARMKNNFIFLAWKKHVTENHVNRPSTAHLVVINLLVLAVAGIFFFRRRFSPELMIAFFMNLTALFYHAPFLLLLHHPEVRYVYPSNCLVIFSLPLFLFFVFEWLVDVIARILLRAREPSP